MRQRDVAKLVGKAVHRPGVMPAPAFGVKLVAGEFAEVIPTPAPPPTSVPAPTGSGDHT